MILMLLYRGQSSQTGMLNRIDTDKILDCILIDTHTSTHTNNKFLDLSY